MSRPSKPTRVEIQLRLENDGLRTTIVCLRREMEDKQGAVGRLEILLSERLRRIDELSNKIVQLRSQNQRLDAEAERLAENGEIVPAALIVLSRFTELKSSCCCDK